MTVSFANLGAVTMAYALSGSPAAPVVALNHCFSGDHRFWDFHLSAFSGYRTLRYDVRGHGQSSRPPGPYTLPMLAGDVVDLIDFLEIERVHFAGVSLGGMIGQTLALSHPERLVRLMLINTTPEYSPEQQQAWRARAAVALAEGMEAIHSDLMQRWFTDAAIAAESPGYRYIAEALRRFPAASFAAVVAAMCDIDTTAALSQINHKTLIIAAPEDPGVPRHLSETLAAKIPDSTLHWLSPARHLATLEHCDHVNRLLAEFLAAP